MGYSLAENRNKFLTALFLPAALAALILACGSSATLIPLTPYVDSYLANPMVHRKGTAIVDGNGQPLRLRGVNPRALAGDLRLDQRSQEKPAAISPRRVEGDGRIHRGG